MFANALSFNKPLDKWDISFAETDNMFNRTRLKELGRLPDWYEVVD